MTSGPFDFLDDMFRRSRAESAQDAMRCADEKLKSQKPRPKIEMPRIQVERNAEGVALLRATLVADMLDALKDDRLTQLAQKLRDL